MGNIAYFKKEFINSNEFSTNNFFNFIFRAQKIIPRKKLFEKNYLLQ